MNRRAWLTGATLLAATAAGVGVALWRQAGAPSATAAPAGFWDLRFNRPDGSEFSLSSHRGQPLLLNFWATWCPPCVTEMPLIDRFAQAQRAQGWQVIGLAVDGPTPVREFLARQPVQFPIGLAGMEGVGLSRSLGNERGALPFTAVFDRAGKVFATKLGSLHEDDLSAWARQLA
jgi:thiol-disulfide isomerase/thioredoxin